MLSFTTTSYAQNPALNEVNLQLRGFFAPLSKPSPAKKFLYEMSAHSADSSWFVANCADTNQTDTWIKVYEEMYYAAYDTSTLTKSDFIINAANNYSNDSIPIGIMNFSFYGLKNDAMNTNNYFNFDTINNVLSDKNPRLGFPYTDNNAIFMSAPLINNASFANPVFVINPAFFYYDSFNADKFSKTAIIQIDFGDGTGWHNFNPTIISYYTPDYSINAVTEPTIRARQYNTTTASIFGSSQSRFFSGLTVAVLPDEILDVQGLNVGVYNGCNTSEATGKTIIYLEGIDIMDFIPGLNRGIRRIYREMLQDDKIIEMKNQGYKFVVVDWKNSRVDMRFNALYVVNLIQELKRRSTDDEQFIIMGESMGGVIARYALTYMESREYLAHSVAPFFTEQNDAQSITYLTLHPGIYNLPTNWVEPEKMHNTGLFISIDAPHRGANIPLSIQKAYKHVFKAVGPFLSTALTITTNAFNIFLDGKAVKQLLIEHVSTETGTGFYKTYSSTSVRNSFMNQLEGMGSYPQFAKIMLMSNGALSGAKQKNYYTGADRIANDRLLQFKAELFARILWIKIPLFGAAIEARTNPDGSGKILEASAGFYSVRIKLKWFGIKVYTGYNSFLNIQDYANTRPYCTSAASTIGTTNPLISTQASSHSFNLSENYWLFNLFSYTNVNDGLGCYRFRAHDGFNGFASLNFNYNLCSDGSFFGFIPVQSALDYGPAGTLGLNTNIERLNINTKLTNIPQRADVMVGNSDLEINPRTGLLERVGGAANKLHVGFRNENIFNVSNVSTVGTTGLENTYYSCINSTPLNHQRVRRGFLNLEIGDEELYLENNTLPYTAEYKVEYDLHLNERNNYYQYPSTIIGSPAANQVLRGIYSKQDAYSITPTGFATFIYDISGAPLNNQGFFGTTTGSFILENQPLINCCIFFGLKGTSQVPPTNKTKLSANDSYLKVFPNPNSGTLLTLQYKFKNIGNVHVTMVDVLGKQVYNSSFFVPNTKLNINSVINLNQFKFPQGLYFVKLTNGIETFTNKLIITQ